MMDLTRRGLLRFAAGSLAIDVRSFSFGRRMADVSGPIYGEAVVALLALDSESVTVTPTRVTVAEQDPQELARQRARGDWPTPAPVLMVMVEYASSGYQQLRGVDMVLFGVKRVRFPAFEPVFLRPGDVATLTLPITLY